MIFLRPKVILLVICSLVVFAAPPVLGEDYSRVKKSFDEFNKAWMKRLYNIEAENFSSMKIKNTGGTYTAEYIGYGPNYRSKVKRTNSAVTPYVGVLTYREIRYVSTGSTAKQVMKGPFTVISSSEVSEIFRYTNGKWLY